jgi:multisubunit Na+/H+ antiporter MnhG subunit
LSAIEVAAICLLGFGVAMELTSVIGILVGGDVWARLHFTGPASTFTPLALAAVVVIDFGPLSQAGIKAVITAALIILLGPSLVHATARSARIRERGSLGLGTERRHPPSGGRRDGEPGAGGEPGGAQR